MTTCDLHGDDANRCHSCRTDAMVDGDRAALMAWHGRANAAECDERLPVRYRPAVADYPDVLAWLERWHSDPSTCPSLLLTGPVGTGKTWQAYGAIRAAVTGTRAAVPNPNGSVVGWSATRWIATTSADMYASIRPQPKRDTEAELAQYRDVDLLMVDDLGAAKPSEWVEEVTYRVVGGRYDAMKPSIFTTNLASAELRDALGARIVSRLVETCIRVKLTGEDRRRMGRAA